MTVFFGWHFIRCLDIFFKDFFALCLPLNQPAQPAQWAHSAEVAKPVKPFEGNPFEKS